MKTILNKFLLILKILGSIFALGLGLNFLMMFSIVFMSPAKAYKVFISKNATDSIPKDVKNLKGTAMGGWQSSSAVVSFNVSPQTCEKIIDDFSEVPQCETFGWFFHTPMDSYALMAEINRMDDTTIPADLTKNVGVRCFQKFEENTIVTLFWDTLHNKAYFYAKNK